MRSTRADVSLAASFTSVERDDVTVELPMEAQSDGSFAVTFDAPHAGAYRLRVAGGAGVEVAEDAFEVMG